MARATDIGTNGFLGAYQIGPSSPEARNGQEGPLDPIGMVRTSGLDPLGYLPEGRRELSVKAIGPTPGRNGTR